MIDSSSNFPQRSKPQFSKTPNSTFSNMFITPNMNLINYKKVVDSPQKLRSLHNSALDNMEHYLKEVVPSKQQDDKNIKRKQSSNSYLISKIDLDKVDISKDQEALINQKKKLNKAGHNKSEIPESFLKDRNINRNSGKTSATPSNNNITKKLHKNISELLTPDINDLKRTTTDSKQLNNNYCQDGTSDNLKNSNFNKNKKSNSVSNTNISISLLF